MRISDWSSDVCSSDLHQPRDYAMFAVMPNGANDRWSDDLAHRATSARGQRLSMKIVIDDLRHRLGHARRALQVLQLSVLDRSGRTDMTHQRLLTCRADTTHFVQRADDGRAGEACVSPCRSWS